MNTQIKSSFRITILLALSAVALAGFMSEPVPDASAAALILGTALPFISAGLAMGLYQRWRKCDEALARYDRECDKALDAPNPLCLGDAEDVE